MSIIRVKANKEKVYSPENQEFIVICSFKKKLTGKL